jgi:hypothetical protein
MGGVHAGSYRVPIRNPAHFFRPRQRSGSHCRAAHCKPQSTFNHSLHYIPCRPPQRPRYLQQSKRIQEGSARAAWALYQTGQEPRPNALRPRKRDFSRPSTPGRRKCLGRGSRVHGDRSQGPRASRKQPTYPSARPTVARGPRLTAIGSRWLRGHAAGH